MAPRARGLYAPAVRSSPTVLAALLLTLAAADADGRVRWRTPGAYRTRVVGIGDVSLDRDGTTTGQHSYGEHRLRIDPSIEVGAVAVRMQIDVLTGQIFGDTNPVGASFVERRHGNPEREYRGWTTVEPRQLHVGLDLHWLEVQAGQLAAHWGMGLLENDGEDGHDAGWVELPGDLRNGDLYDRVRVAGTPLAAATHGPLADLVVAAGADYVWQDEEANALAGDSAARFFGSVYYPGELVFLGLHGVYRLQEDRDGDELSVGALDAYGQYLAPLYLLRARARLQGEALLRFGNTDRHRPGGRTAGVDLLQLGWAGRAEIAWRCPRIALGAEVGYASGDADPDDGDKRDMTFDPDHRVGFLLFTDVLRLITLRGAERLAAPERVGVAEGGAEQLPTDGAVRNAWYVQPGLTWRPGRWQLAAGALVALAAEPFLDPFETFAAGGSARSHRGTRAQSFYGVEVSGGIRYGVHLDRVGDASLGVDGGLLLPGGALGPGFGDETVGKVVGRIDLRW